MSKKNIHQSISAPKLKSYENKQQSARLSRCFIVVIIDTVVGGGYLTTPQFDTPLETYGNQQQLVELSRLAMASMQLRESTMQQYLPPQKSHVLWARVATQLHLHTTSARFSLLSRMKTQRLSQRLNNHLLSVPVTPCVSTSSLVIHRGRCVFSTRFIMLAHMKTQRPIQRLNDHLL